MERIPIQHIGKYFVLGKQGSDVAKISEAQLFECLEILKADLELQTMERILWADVIEYLQNQNEN